jgi:HEAT repeat protein
MLIAQLDDEAYLVRYASVQVLGRITAANDEQAISTVAIRLEDDFECVRNAASEALTRICMHLESGIQRVFDLVSSRVAHQHWHVRQAAIQALGKLAGVGSELVIPVIVERLEDEFYHVRHAAIEVLGQIATERHEPAVFALCARLEDEVEVVRRVAFQAVTHIVKRAKLGSQPIIAILSCRLTHKLWDVRQAAVNALRELTGKGDEAVITALRERLEDECNLVRRSAIEALGQLTEMSDKLTISAVHCRYIDVRECYLVRMAAKEAFNRIFARLT